MINIYFDNLSPQEARELFDAFSRKGYVSSVECNLDAHSFSVRLEGYDRFTFLTDLAEHFL